MEDMKLYDFDDELREFYGEVGTPRRDEHERKVAQALRASRIGEAIKRERERQNLTQEQLGERMGVKKTQISRLERGYSITLPTMEAVFKALNVKSASVDLGSAGRIALW